jgi:phospholipid-binding lipoprotein MlaA
MRGSLAALAVFAACLAMPQRAQAQEYVYDPYEHFNRRMFAVHEAIDKAVLEPVARGYRAITPRPLRTGVGNFLSNLTSPVIFANDVLQGRFKRAGTTAARFGVNTTIGVLGFFDPAHAMLGLEHHDGDFGQTLAVWGVKSGPYLFIPVLGPTNLRDGAGQLVDLALDPINWAHFHNDNEWRVTRAVASGISTREALLDPIDDIRSSSIDPYVTIRSSYGLLRYSQIQNSRNGAQALPNFEEIPPEDQTPPSPAPAPEGTTPGGQNQGQPQGATPNRPQTPPSGGGSPSASFLPGD